MDSAASLLSDNGPSVVKQIVLQGCTRNGSDNTTLVRPNLCSIFSQMVSNFLLFPYRKSACFRKGHTVL